MRNRWIDAHHHLWQYNSGEYPWMSEEMEALRRDFLPPDLEQVARRNGVTATVAVQARQQIDETSFLLKAAQQTPLIAGVVGWVPLIDRDVSAHLERYAQDGHLKGVRHVLHDEPDPLYILRADFNEGVAQLKRYNLRYDLLIFAKHLPQTITFVDCHPNQVFIVDHIAKPRIASGEIAGWTKSIHALAGRENIYCKISGMITEADWKSWTADQLKPYFDVILDAFGPSRLMFGSDWPVLTLASSYEQWIRVLANWIEELSDEEADAIQYRTAVRAYGLKQFAD